MINPQRYHFARLLLLGFLMVALVVGMTFWGGCSSRTTRRIAFDLKSPDAHLKKQIGIAYLKNHTTFGDVGLNTFFERELITHLKEEGPNLLIKKPGDREFPAAIFEPVLMANGQIDNLALAQAGRQIGLNAVLVCTLYDVRQEQETTGMLWFKGTRAFIYVQVLTEVFDTLTGAKILDEGYIREIELSKERSTLMRDDLTLTTSTIMEGLTKLIPDMSEDIIDVVLTKPWRGFIRATSGSKVFISSGRRAGVRKEDLFEVNQGDRILAGTDGQRFFLPSGPYAKLKVTTVFPEWSETVTLEGGPVTLGSYLRPVR